jgi:hypothetical protein
MYYHIVIGDSTWGNLKNYFSRNKSKYQGQIFNFGDDLSNGPISQFSKASLIDEMINERIRCLKMVYSKIGVIKLVSEESIDSDLKKMST